MDVIDFRLRDTYSKTAIEKTETPTAFISTCPSAYTQFAFLLPYLPTGASNRWNLVSLIPAKFPGAPWVLASSPLRH